MRKKTWWFSLLAHAVMDRCCQQVRVLAAAAAAAACVSTRPTVRCRRPYNRWRPWRLYQSTHSSHQ